MAAVGWTPGWRVRAPPRGAAESRWRGARCHPTGLKQLDGSSRSKLQVTEMRRVRFTGDEIFWLGGPFGFVVFTTLRTAPSRAP
jgi:hypothetical protein